MLTRFDRTADIRKSMKSYQLRKTLSKKNNRAINLIPRFPKYCEYASSLLLGLKFTLL
jgi:hypothetical protein